MSQTLDEKITLLSDLYERTKDIMHELTPVPLEGTVAHTAHIHLYDLLRQMRDMCVEAILAQEAATAGKLMGLVDVAEKDITEMKKNYFERVANNT